MSECWCQKLLYQSLGTFCAPISTSSVKRYAKNAPSGDPSDQVSTECVLFNLNKRVFLQNQSKFIKLII